MKENILFRIVQKDIKTIDDLKRGVDENIELLFIVFINNFSQLRDNKIVFNIKTFSDLELVRDKIALINEFYSQIPKFSDFIGVLKRYVKITEDDSNDNHLIKFIKKFKLKIDFRVKSNISSIDLNDESLIKSVDILFNRYSNSQIIMDTSDFIRFCKDYKIIPILFSTFKVVCLFYQINLRINKVALVNVYDMINEEILINTTKDGFVMLLYEIGEWIKGDTIYLNIERQVRLIFDRFIGNLDKIREGR